jgi:hypothetical protein
LKLFVESKAWQLILVVLGVPTLAISIFLWKFHPRTDSVEFNVAVIMAVLWASVLFWVFSDTVCAVSKEEAVMNARSLFTLVLAAPLFAACGTPSQTREEFRSKVARGAAGSGMDTYIAKRDFDRVAATLKQKSEECLNYEARQSRSEGGMTTSSSVTDYTANFRLMSSNHAELTIRRNPKSKLSFAPGAPEGGLYYVAIDIDRVSPGATKLTYYGPSGWSKGYAAVKSWSDGQLVKCPYT